MKVRVYYEDTDVGAVVYHTNYLKYCERARSEIFFKNGLSPHSKNSFFVVKNLEANFIKPAIFGDVLEVRSSLQSLKNVSLTINQHIFRNEELLFEAVVKVVYLKDRKPSKIPTNIIDMFEKI